jgi:hypothetical protein
MSRLGLGKPAAASDAAAKTIRVNLDSVPFMANLFLDKQAARGINNRFSDRSRKGFIARSPSASGKCARRG